MPEPSTEQTILAAAERLFLDQGFARTSVNQIAQEAGCNQALINYYFRTKEKLFLRILLQKLGLLSPHLKAAAQGAAPFRERLRHLVEQHFEIMTQNPKLPRFVLNEIAVNPAWLSELTQGLGTSLGPHFAELKAELRVEIEAGRIRPIRLEEILMTFVSLNIGPFLLAPLLERVFQTNDVPLELVLKARGQENARILLASLEIGETK